MTRALPRANFNSSRLVRLLADLAVAGVDAPKRSFAERLGQWLEVTDAITLHAALNSRAASAPGAPDARSGTPSAASLRQEFARVRSALAGSITSGGPVDAGTAQASSPTPAAGESGTGGADFRPYHRYYVARQRDIEAGVGQLRAAVRATLADRSPALRRLAALDTALDQALSARERNLLASVPLLLEKRFVRLREAHREALADTQPSDAAEPPTPPGGWLAAFCEDLQGVLLAELDLRLQPVLGMIEALGNETTKHP